MVHGRSILQNGSSEEFDNDTMRLILFKSVFVMYGTPGVSGKASALMAQVSNVGEKVIYVDES